MRKISRKKKIEGTTIPGIVYNSHYYYSDIDVYEDGMVNCWELVDLDGLREKLNSNWLLPQICENEMLSIFELGWYKIKSAKWNFDNGTFFADFQCPISINLGILGTVLFICTKLSYYKQAIL